METSPIAHIAIAETTPTVQPCYLQEHVHHRSSNEHVLEDLLHHRPHSSADFSDSSSGIGAPISLDDPSAKGARLKFTNKCANCGTTSTPLWRRGPQGQVICNACGLYLKARNASRPAWLKQRAIKPLKKSNLSAVAAHASHLIASIAPVALSMAGPALTSTVPTTSNMSPSVSTPTTGLEILSAVSASVSTSPSDPKTAQPKSLINCVNCGTANTPLWRRDERGNPICNACGLYYRLHNSHRPVSLKGAVIKRRKRVPINNPSGPSTPVLAPTPAQPISDSPDSWPSESPRSLPSDEISEPVPMQQQLPASHTPRNNSSPALYQQKIDTSFAQHAAAAHRMSPMLPPAAQPSVALPSLRSMLPPLASESASPLAQIQIDPSLPPESLLRMRTDLLNTVNRIDAILSLHQMRNGRDPTLHNLHNQNRPHLPDLGLPVQQRLADAPMHSTARSSTDPTQHHLSEHPTSASMGPYRPEHTSIVLPPLRTTTPSQQPSHSAHPSAGIISRAGPSFADMEVTFSPPGHVVNPLMTLANVSVGFPRTDF